VAEQIPESQRHGDDEQPGDSDDPPPGAPRRGELGRPGPGGGGDRDRHELGRVPTSSGIVQHGHGTPSLQTKRREAPGYYYGHRGEDLAPIDLRGYFFQNFTTSRTTSSGRPTIRSSVVQGNPPRPDVAEVEEAEAPTRPVPGYPGSVGDGATVAAGCLAPRAAEATLPAVLTSPEKKSVMPTLEPPELAGAAAGGTTDTGAAAWRDNPEKRRAPNLDQNDRLSVNTVAPLPAGGGPLAA
jgi:hypothetical protein